MRDTTNEREFDSRFDAAFQPGFDETGDLDLAGLGAIAPDLLADPEAERPGPARRRPLIDRFVVVLWIVGVALVVGGLVCLVNVVAASYGDSASSSFTPDYQMLILLMQLAPWFVVVGLATLIGTLFLLAVRWERRP